MWCYCTGQNTLWNSLWKYETMQNKSKIKDVVLWAQSETDSCKISGHDATSHRTTNNVDLCNSDLTICKLLWWSFQISLDKSRKRAKYKFWDQYYGSTALQNEGGHSTAAYRIKTPSWTVGLGFLNLELTLWMISNITRGSAKRPQTVLGFVMNMYQYTYTIIYI